MKTALTGQHNVSNILAASAACLALGLSAAEVAEGVRSLENVPGRFEKVDLGQPFLVVVDYAHTEDALARVLEFARPVTKGRLLTLMGCGGDRDRNKRPLMAAAALRASDRVFMTSDNPRTEDPEAILREVEAGAELVEGGRERSRTVADRREAIRGIIAEAGPGDTVVIAGKGHETYQIVGDERLPFDDCEEARKALRHLGYGR
ncbi:glutamate ligase domain-containing protein [Nitrospinota bacterium]